ncbi:MAG: molybdopterin converting factor subunit 1 [Acetobacteraceae bacterium]|nr:molybdopterin converting factor subunit 1 [Acetobacteraceae bacterium]
MAATLHLLYFAWLRERIGTGEEHVAMPAGVDTVAGLLAWLRGRGAGYEAAFGTAAPVRCAINQEFATHDAAVAAGDEVAFFPPVTGG